MAMMWNFELMNLSSKTVLMRTFDQLQALEVLEVLVLSKAGLASQ